jgi:hypothetical protein
MRELLWALEVLVTVWLSGKMIAAERQSNLARVVSAAGERCFRNSLRSLVHDKMIFTDETATFGVL